MRLVAEGTARRAAGYLLALLGVASTFSGAAAQTDSVVSQALDTGTTTRLVRTTDSTVDIVLSNRKHAPVKVWMVAVYECHFIRQGCGTSDPQLVVRTDTTVILRSARVVPKVWHLRYEIDWREQPIASGVTLKAIFRKSGPGSLVVAPLAVAHAGFRPIGRAHSNVAWQMVNPAKRMTVWIEQDSAYAGDSLNVELSGALIPVEEPGRTVADELKWQPILAGDSASVAALTALMAAIHGAESLAVVRPLDTSQANHEAILSEAPTGSRRIIPRTLADGRRVVCRYSSEQPTTSFVVDLVQVDDWCSAEGNAGPFKYNSLVVTNPAKSEIGATLALCSAYSASLPSDWVRVYWYNDSAQCPADGVVADPAQPNILVVKRRR